MRRLLTQERVTLRFTDHAIIEARKDGLTVEDLEDNIINGELVEDYGIRALFLNFTKDDELPCHVVLEYYTTTLKMRSCHCERSEAISVCTSP